MQEDPKPSPADSSTVTVTVTARTGTVTATDSLDAVYNCITIVIDMMIE